MSPASISTIPQEILDLILENIRGSCDIDQPVYSRPDTRRDTRAILHKRGILNLGLTNKSFLRKVFPFFYREVSLIRQYPWDNIRDGLAVFAKDAFVNTATGKVLGSPGGEFVRRLGVADKGLYFVGNEWRPLMFPVDNKNDRAMTKEDRKMFLACLDGLLREVLAVAPNIESFSVGGVSGLTKETAELIRNKTNEGRLTRVLLAFHEDMLRLRDIQDVQLRHFSRGPFNWQLNIDENICHFSISGFRNLVSLKIFNLCCDIATYVREIVGVLVENSHTLREIGFSVSSKIETCNHSIYKETGRDTKDVPGFEELQDNFDQGFELDPRWHGLWENICLLYARRQTTGQKLQIESLALGSGFDLFMRRLDPDSKPYPIVFDAALDLKQLQRLEFSRGKAGATFKMQRCSKAHGSCRTVKPDISWYGLAQCTGLQEIFGAHLHVDMHQEFFIRRAALNAKPITKWVGRDMSALTADWGQDYLDHVITEHLVQFEMDYPLWELNRFKSCKSLEIVRIDTQWVEDDYLVEQEAARQGQGTDDIYNPLSYFLDCHKLRTISIDVARWKPDWKEYVQGLLNENRWTHLETIEMIHSSPTGYPRYHECCGIRRNHKGTRELFNIHIKPIS